MYVAQSFSKRMFLIGLAKLVDILGYSYLIMAYSLSLLIY